MIRWTNAHKDAAGAEADVDFLSWDVACTARAVLSRFPGYAPTPLVPLDEAAQQFGVRQVLVKDEGHRFGLMAFKALGSAYAIANHVSQVLGAPVTEFDPRLLDDAARQRLGNTTFVTASTGNHGTGVAWVAHELGLKAIIYLPNDTAPARLQRILDLGADVRKVPGSFDDAGEHARRDAERNRWCVIADTAWPGYEDVPRWVMQGYTTIAHEIDEALTATGGAKPTHLIVQAGVGSLAAALTGHLVSRYGEERPFIAVVEPEHATCFYHSAQFRDGAAHAFDEPIDTTMSGLACGVPSELAWPILRDYTDLFVVCSDDVALDGMRALARPKGGDPAITAGPSGGVGIGVLRKMADNGLEGLRDALQLTPESRVLLINTEGATDPAACRAALDA